MNLNNSKDFLVIVVIIIVILLFCMPFMTKLNYISSNEDWGQIYSYYATVRKAILSQHQFPLRTPYFGGGYPLVANPQDGSLSPLLLFILLFGEIVGTKIICLLAYIAAAIGMYYLARREFEFNIAGALFSSLVVSLSGWLPYQLYDGNFTKIYYYFMPLLIFLFLKTNKDTRYLFFGCLLTSIILFQGGLGFVACSLFLFLFALCQTKVKRDRHILRAEVDYLKLFILLIIITLLIGAVKIFLFFQLLRDASSTSSNYHYTELPEYFYYDLNTFFKALFQKHYLNGGAIYLGYFPVALCVVSLLVFWRKLAKYFILLLVIIFICFASNAPIDIFRIFHHVPIFNYIAKPSKYFSFFIVFLISLIGGHLFVWIEKLRFIKKQIKHLLMYLLLSYPVLNLFFVNIDFHQKIFNARYYFPQENFEFCQAEIVNLENKWDAGLIQYDLVNRNIGLINWYGNVYLPENAEPKFIIDLKNKEKGKLHYDWIINSSYRGELYFLSGKNKAIFKYFSPNKLVIRVELNKSDRLIINQNYHRYWTANKGRIENYKGLLSVVSLPHGVYEIELDYRPINFYLGLGVSVISLIIFALRFFSVRRFF